MTVLAVSVAFLIGRLLVLAVRGLVSVGKFVALLIAFCFAMS